MKGEETEVRDYPCLYPQLPGEIWVRSLKWFPLFSFQRGKINTFYIEKKTNLYLLLRMRPMNDTQEEDSIGTSLTAS